MRYQVSNGWNTNLPITIAVESTKFLRLEACVHFFHRRYVHMG